MPRGALGGRAGEAVGGYFPRAKDDGGANFTAEEQRALAAFFTAVSDAPR